MSTGRLIDELRSHRPAVASHRCHSRASVSTWTATVPAGAAVTAAHPNPPTPDQTRSAGPLRAPRAHPVSPVLGAGRLFLFMEPTSPKGRDLRRDGRYAMHSPVDGPVPTVPQFYLTGTGRPVDHDPDLRAAAVQAAGYPVQDRFVLYELDIDAIMCTTYDTVDPYNQPPVREYWPAR